MNRGAFFLITMLACAQEPIRVTTRLVEVNVVVRDGNGPVRGLTRDDFTIFDQGKEQKIAVFRFTDSAPASAGAGAIKSQTASSAPGVVTNRYAAGAAPPNVTVLLIDALNTEIADQQNVRKLLQGFFEDLDPQRKIAIYLLGNQIRVLQDFTSERTLLEKAIDKVHGVHSSDLTAATTANPIDLAQAVDPHYEASDDVMHEMVNEMRDAHNVNRAEVTMSALEQIARHLAKVPGRKTLIWVSSSFPFFLETDERHAGLAAPREERTFNPEMTQAARILNAADVAIYTVDPRGIAAMPISTATDTNPPVGNPRQRRQFGTRQNGQLGIFDVDQPEGFETMQQMADATGGRAFYNTNDLRGAVAKSMADGEASYTLGFYAGEPDSTYHELKVKLDRGGDVRYRRGYFSFESKVPDEKERMAMLREAAASPLDSTGIGLTAGVGHEDGATLAGVIVNFSDLSLEQSGGRWRGEAEMIFVPLGSDGAALPLTSKELNFDMSEEAYRAKLRDNFTITQKVDAKAARVRVVIIDAKSGAIGSVTVPVL